MLACNELFVGDECRRFSVGAHSERRRKRTGDVSFERCCVTMHAENNCKICKVVECREKLFGLTHAKKKFAGANKNAVDARRRRLNCNDRKVM